MKIEKEFRKRYLGPRCSLGLLASLFACIGLVSASAQVTNRFNDGQGTETSDQFPGTATDGWVEGWTSILGVNGAANGFFGIEPRVVTNGFGTPLFGGGNYFNFGIANSESTMRRRFGNGPALDVTEVHVIEFDIRMEWIPNSFNNGNDYITICCRPNTSSGSSQNQSTFWIKAPGANATSGTATALGNRWNFYEGSTASSSEGSGIFFSSTNVPLFLGTNYHFKIQTDPSTKTYSASVTDGVNTFNTGTLRWRNFSTTSEGDRTNATFFTIATRTSTRNDLNVNPVTETNIVSLDNLIIYQGSLDNVAPKVSKIYPLDGHVSLATDTNMVFNFFTIGSTNTFPASNAVLVLNGVDVSAGLTFNETDASSNRTATYNNGFAPNTIYNGYFVARDQAGRSTTNVFWFDTFVASDVTIIESEHYNFSTNLCPGISVQTNINPARYIQSPLFSGQGTLDFVNLNEGYFGRTGEAAVDYNDSNPDTGFDFRSLPTGCDPVGMRKKTSVDYERPELTALTLPEYITERWKTNDWLNYTHVWPGTNYLVYLRVGSGANQQFQLDLVTSNYQLPGQTTSPLGIFNCPVFQRREALAYQLLRDSLGNPVQVYLNGEQTLRVTSLNSPDSDQAYINFMLFLPQTGTAPPYTTQVLPVPNSINVPPDTNVSVTIAKGTLPVDTGTVLLIINGANVTGSAVVTPTATGATVSCLPPTFFPQGATNTVQVVYGDGTGPLQTNQWSFRTGMYVPGFDRVLRHPAANGANFTFSINTVNRAQHIIEYKDSLPGTSWTTLTNIVGNGSAIGVSDNTGGDQRYYRMRIP